jgi:phage shock protein A
MLRADVHGVMDQLEERSLLLKQHLREAEVEVARKRARLEALDEERQRVGEDAERLEARVRSLDEDVELALTGEDRDLARFAVRRLLPKREALHELLARGKQLDEQRAQLEERLREQEEQLALLRPRVRAELASAVREPELALADAIASDEEVELELLRRAATAEGGVR